MLFMTFPSSGGFLRGPGRSELRLYENSKSRG